MRKIKLQGEIRGRERREVELEIVDQDTNRTVVRWTDDKLAIFNGDSVYRISETRHTTLLFNASEVNVANSLKIISSHLYNAALEVDEFKNLSMDLQGEITKRVMTWFIDCINDEVKNFTGD